LPLDRIVGRDQAIVDDCQAEYDAALAALREVAAGQVAADIFLPTDSRPSDPTQTVEAATDGVSP
jgi:hypothetical protein